MTILKQADRSEFNNGRHAALQWLILAVSMMALTGCASLNSIHRTTDISKDGRAISVDAKQRFLVSGYSHTDEHGWLRKFCVEPSPDVFSAFAASLSGSAKTKAFEAALDSAFSENAATIGIRTQAIQLLRDGMYRICEGAMNGTVTNEQFVDLHRRYQRIMVTLVAIEQLTGAVRPPSVAIQTDALAGRPARLNDLQIELEKARKKVSELKAAIAETGVKTFTRPKEGEENQTETLKCSAVNLEELSEVNECADYVNAKNNLTDAEENEKALVKDIEAARAEMVNRASGTVTLVNNQGAGSQLSSASATKVSETVKEMVNSMFRLDPDTAIDKFGHYKCPVYLEADQMIDNAEAIKRKAAQSGAISIADLPDVIRFRSTFRDKDLGTSATASDIVNEAEMLILDALSKVRSVQGDASQVERGDAEETTSVRRTAGICKALLYAVNPDVK